MHNNNALKRKASHQKTSKENPAVNTAQAFKDSYHLPPGYNNTQITLIARDPNWIYAYWEIGKGAVDYLRDRIREGFDRSTYVLRMYDVTCIDFNGNNANSQFEIDVGAQANNWYIPLWSDNVTYCADLGMRAPDGRFFPIARSNFITTPRKGLSSRADLIWMEVKEQKPSRPFVAAETPSKKADGKAPRPHHRRRRIFLSEEDVRAYYSKLFPIYKLIISSRRLRSGERLNSESLKRGYLPGIGAWEEVVMRGGASEQRGGASEREVKPPQFFFEIGTELIVYGRTEPDAEVWLGDKKITLRKDGTFTLRFALPDGKIPLDFTAISQDAAQTRKIKTSVEREKTTRE